MEITKYCLCCGEDVPISVVIRHGRRELNCAFCGFALDFQNINEPASAETRQISKGGYALVTDDSRYTRKIIVDLLKEKKQSSHIMSFENGLELIAAYSKMLIEKKYADIAIIDLNMPVMDGLTAAKTIRALETQNKSQVAPIVFFSAEKCDDNLKRQLEVLEPANYVNKGTDPDPDKLAARVEFLLDYIDENNKTNHYQA